MKSTQEKAELAALSCEQASVECRVRKKLNALKNRLSPCTQKSSLCLFITCLPDSPTSRCNSDPEPRLDSSAVQDHESGSRLEIHFMASERSLVFVFSLWSPEVIYKPRKKLYFQVSASQRLNFINYQ